ncbi:uncharacterized protein LOC142606348 [Castanea sativa]|uniref:uncharacterized protein LOC142606348 n=1 Tax=Castanea sativa TaxID=21020 RepID=UPI003F650557
MSWPEKEEVLFAYVAVASYAVSLVLLRVDNGVQRPVYYVSKSLHEAEVRYLPLEKAILAVVHATQIGGKIMEVFSDSRLVVDQEADPCLIEPSPRDIGGRICRRKYKRHFSKAAGNKRWLLVGTDYFTKWVKVEPLSNIKELDAKRFVWKNIVTRFEILHTLISDNGLQFDSKAFRRYCCDLGIKNRCSTPAYPQGNGQAKTVNKVIVTGLKKMLEDAKGKWVEELSYVLWIYRTIPYRSRGETPFSMTYGAEAVIPLEIGLPTLRTSLFTPHSNDNLLEKGLDLIEEWRENATVQLAYYQQKLKQRYDSNVRLRPLAPRDLVLRKVLGTAKNLA